MFIITKKMIKKSFIILLLFISIYGITILNINHKLIKELKSTETVAFPVDSKVIIIDARTRNTR